MRNMRVRGNYIKEFDESFPGEFVSSHSDQAWTTYKALYWGYFDIHGHMDVPAMEPGIGRHMSQMRTRGNYRKEFDAVFPGLFWSSHSKRMWTCKYKPLYSDHLDTHGHLNVPYGEPVIGPHMRNMRARGNYKKEFDLAFPGQFWKSRKVKS
jgi:hypothetical protein